MLSDNKESLIFEGKGSLSREGEVLTRGQVVTSGHWKVSHVRFPSTIADPCADFFNCDSEVEAEAMVIVTEQYEDDIKHVMVRLVRTDEGKEVNGHYITGYNNALVDARDIAQHEQLSSFLRWGVQNTQKDPIPLLKHLAKRFWLKGA